MIELRDVSKKFDNNYILKDINLKMPRYGIVSIYGPSGCGKTTLLNLLSSLEPFEGEISFNGKRYSLLSEKDRDELRNNKIGFIFQDYKLFESETLSRNLMLSLDIKSDDKKKTKERKIEDLLKIVGLGNRGDKSVSTLSGGEKQRLAIARAIINSPKVILADEPTGNLDEQNSVQIMDLLQKIARKSLVVLVSHDYELVKRYSDQIVFLKDGKIEKITYNEHNQHVDNVPLIHITPKEKKARLPLSFCFSHAYRGVTKRRWRTMFILMTTSLGLFGVGLGTTLKDMISTNLYKSYSSIIDANKVVVRKKNNGETPSNKVTALEYEDVIDIANTYKKDIKDVGVYYWNDFEKMFTSYSFCLDVTGEKKNLPSFSLNLFNDFDVLENIYNPQPIEANDLQIDEVVVDLDVLTLQEICYQLRIPKTVKSLSEYMTMSDLYLIVDIGNSNWHYDASFSLKIRAFSLARSVKFYHSNRHWNEYIFEQCCHLPTSEQISGVSKNPWDLKKSYYLEFSNNRDKFLEDIKFQRKYQYILGEILDEKYYPNIYKDVEPHKCNRVCLLSKEHKDEIEGYISPYIKKTSNHISSLIYGSQYSYAIYPDNLMMGFARETYLSNDYNKIEEMVDLTTYLKYEESMNMVVPDSIVEGHFAKPSSSSLTFNPSYTLLGGREPTSYQEIVISKGIMDKLNIEYPIASMIYLAFPVKEELLPNGYLLRKFQTANLKIVGVSTSEKLELSHNENWTIMFFQTMLGISSLDLSINSLALSVSDNKEHEVINILDQAFPYYESVSPIQSVKESIDNICKYIETILLILSISSVIIASILLSLCNHLHFIEIKKDIGLVRCLGINKGESAKMIYAHSGLMVILSMIFAVFELFITCLVLMKAFGSILSIDSTFIFNPLSLLYMFLVAAGISLLSSLNIKRRVRKLNPLDCLR